MRKIMWLSLAVTGAIALSLTAFWFVGGFGNDLDTVEAVSSGISNRADDGLGEGIKVHGNWELTVSDSDGSNPVVYNFKNTLAAGGGAALSALMLPEGHFAAEAMQRWKVKFWRSPPTGSENLLCGPIAEASLTANKQGIMLRAVCTIDGDIFSEPQELSVVSTRAESVATDGKTWGRALTVKNLDAPITVAPWQLLAATVYITFE
jgi:hypothetical protein